MLQSGDCWKDFPFPDGTLTKLTGKFIILIYFNGTLPQNHHQCFQILKKHKSFQCGFLPLHRLKGHVFHPHLFGDLCGQDFQTCKGIKGRWQPTLSCWPFASRIFTEKWSSSAHLLITIRTANIQPFIQPRLPEALVKAAPQRPMHPYDLGAPEGGNCQIEICCCCCCCFNRGWA